MMERQGKDAAQRRKAEKRAAALRENLRRRKEAGGGKPAPAQDGSGNAEEVANEEGSDKDE